MILNIKIKVLLILLITLLILGYITYTSSKPKTQISDSQGSNYTLSYNTNSIESTLTLSYTDVIVANNTNYQQDVNYFFPKLDEINCLNLDTKNTTYDLVKFNYNETIRSIRLTDYDIFKIGDISIFEWTNEECPDCSNCFSNENKRVLQYNLNDPKTYMIKTEGLDKILNGEDKFILRIMQSDDPNSWSDIVYTDNAGSTVYFCYAKYKLNDKDDNSWVELFPDLNQKISYTCILDNQEFTITFTPNN